MHIHTYIKWTPSQEKLLKKQNKNICFKDNGLMAQFSGSIIRRQCLG